MRLRLFEMQHVGTLREKAIENPRQHLSPNVIRGLFYSIELTGVKLYKL